MIAYPEILALTETGRRFEWNERDVMLYGLSVGFGADPLNEAELAFVYERDLKVLPTFGSVLAAGAGVSPDRMSLNRIHVLHAAEDVTFHRPLPIFGALLEASRVLAVHDKGPKGAIIVRETVLSDPADRQPVVTIERTAIARADGGFGGPTGDLPPPHQPPARTPDVTVEIDTRADQALLYRLCGDRNPLHVDPAVARQAGFAAPILHGLCTYSITCRVVLQTYAGYDPSRIRRHAARFARPVTPGDRLVIDLWRDAEVVSFEARLAGSETYVIRNGRTLLG